MLPTSAGVEPATSWSPVGRCIQLSHPRPAEREKEGCIWRVYKSITSMSLWEREREREREGERVYCIWRVYCGKEWERNRDRQTDRQTESRWYTLYDVYTNLTKELLYQLIALDMTQMGWLGPKPQQKQKKKKKKKKHENVDNKYCSLSRLRSNVQVTCECLALDPCSYWRSLSGIGS